LILRSNVPEPRVQIAEEWNAWKHSLDRPALGIQVDHFCFRQELDCRSDFWGLQTKTMDSDVPQELISDRRHPSEIDRKPDCAAKGDERLKFGCSGLTRGDQDIV